MEEVGGAAAEIVIDATTTAAEVVGDVGADMSGGFFKSTETAMGVVNEMSGPDQELGWLGVLSHAIVEGEVDMGPVSTETGLVPYEAGEQAVAVSMDMWGVGQDQFEVDMEIVDGHWEKIVQDGGVDASQGEVIGQDEWGYTLLTKGEVVAASSVMALLNIMGEVTISQVVFEEEEAGVVVDGEKQSRSAKVMLQSESLQGIAVEVELDDAVPLLEDGMADISGLLDANVTAMEVVALLPASVGGE